MKQLDTISHAFPSIHYFTCKESQRNIKIQK